MTSMPPKPPRLSLNPDKLGGRPGGLYMELQSWRFLLEDHFQGEGIPKDEWGKAAGHYLSGWAAVEYYSFRGKHGDNISWETVVEKLTNLAKSLGVPPRENVNKVLQYNMVEACYEGKRPGEKPHPLAYGLDVFDTLIRQEEHSFV
jgi:hypothetical protein